MTTQQPDIFERINDMIAIAYKQGIKPKLITIGAVKTLEWEAALKLVPDFTPEAVGCSFCGIPVELDSETPGITLG